MNAVTPFLFDDEHMVRVLAENDEPWFVAIDIASVLGYARPDNAVSRHCRHARTCTLETGGQVRQVNIIPEGDIYRLVMRSKLPSAERFEEWVVGEVLPSIRRTGAYGHQERTAEYAAQRQALRLMDRIRGETAPDVRRSLHAMLERTLSGIGVPTPPLSAIGADAVPVALIAAPFWRALDGLDAKGIAYNHARDPERIAVNLRHLESLFARHGGGVAMTGSLRHALKQSTAPRFLAIKAVNSALTGKTVKCWVWERPRDESA